MRLRAAFISWTAPNALMLILALLSLLSAPPRLEARTQWALAALALLYMPVAAQIDFSQSKIPILRLLGHQ
jgi:hypothetical protein